MKFYSTSDSKSKKTLVSLETAVMNGLAKDGGLYMPEKIPTLPKNFFLKAKNMTFQEIAFEASKLFFMPDIPEKVLKKLVYESFNFKVPIIKLNEEINVLELFHGPTCAFKDFAARFMARLISHFAEKSGKEITILVATSGDTGSAVAHGFLGVKNIKVVILYPSGKVSPLQEKQLTGMGKNITALEVRGTFDDCQKLVKEAFMHKELQEKMTLASANSINIARLLPQSFYYVYLASRLYDKDKKLIVSVPSGNFGNLTAGLIAKKLGAPIYRFIASTNVNAVVPKYLETGKFKPTPSLSTISNAMDVGNPSNFARMVDLYKNDLKKIRGDIYGVSFSDKETKKAISYVYEKYKYIPDPHGAVAYLGLVEYLKNSKNNTGVFLETAHPVKFGEIVEEVIKKEVPMPKQLKSYLKKEKKSIELPNNFEELKKFLLGYSFKEPQHIGIVSVTAEGGSLCYRTIIQESARILGPNVHPKITLYSSSFSEILKAQQSNNWETVANICLSSIKTLKDTGVQFAIMPANSVHFAFDKIKNKSPIEVISIVEVALKHCQENKYSKVGVLGVGITMEKGLYEKIFSKSGIKTIVPDKEDREILNEIIYKEIVLGKIKKESVQKIINMIEKLKRANCQAVILGCTELPLVITKKNSPIPIIDTTRLLAIYATHKSINQ